MAGLEKSLTSAEPVEDVETEGYSRKCMSGEFIPLLILNVLFIDHRRASFVIFYFSNDLLEVFCRSDFGCVLIFV
jgi:hypothetical protein